MKRTVMLAAIGMMAFAATAQSQQAQSGSSNGTEQSKSRNWVRFADYDENAYVDLNSVQKRNQKAVFDVLKNYEKFQTTANGTKYKSIVRSWQFDCKKKIARDINVEVHPDEMGKGPFYQAGAPDEFAPFDQDDPKTEKDTYAYFACGRPGNYEFMSQDSHPKLFRMCDHRKLTTISKDNVDAISKKLRIEIDFKNQIIPDSGKYVKYTLEAKRPGFKVGFYTPEGIKGPFDASGNKLDKPISLSVGPVDGGEVVLKGAISKSALIVQHASFTRTLRPDLQLSAADTDNVANMQLRAYGFDVCRATKIGDIKVPSGAKISTYKASGYSIFNGIEKDDDKNNRVSMIVASIALPDQVGMYFFVTAVVENDIKLFEENQKEYDDMALRYFTSMFSGYTIDYLPVSNK